MVLRLILMTTDITLYLLNIASIKNYGNVGNIERGTREETRESGVSIGRVDQSGRPQTMTTRQRRYSAFSKFSDVSVGSYELKDPQRN